MKPIASLSLDLDKQWSYMKTHGNAGWESFPSYLDVAVPRRLAFLRERQLTITFFIVGQDAALEKNHEVLRTIADAGHEIGNHSFNHEPWLHLYSEAQLDQELARAEESIELATGARPLGFRGPGFSLSLTTLEVLAGRGYLYDATVFPNLLNPLAVESALDDNSPSQCPADVRSASSRVVALRKTEMPHGEECVVGVFAVRLIIRPAPAKRFSGPERIEKVERLALQRREPHLLPG